MTWSLGGVWVLHLSRRRARFGPTWVTAGPCVAPRGELQGALRAGLHARGSVSTGVWLAMHTPTSPAFTVCMMEKSPPSSVSQCLLNSAAVGLLSPQDARAAATRAAKIKLRAFEGVFMVLRPRPRKDSVRRASSPTFLSARRAARSVARHTSGIGGPTEVLESEAGFPARSCNVA